jgi:polysaccharide biosynthesis/export protein
MTVMNPTLPKKITLSMFAFGCLFLTDGFGQTGETQTRNVNFRYSQNPKTRNKPETAVNQAETATEETQNAEVEPPSIAKKTLEIARKANVVAMSPTEIYRVGNGDVLFINFQNAPKSSTYYTVLNDGTLDFPLAGEMFSVNGLTTDEIEDLLKEKIKLFENPQISVKVREYASHSISVLGLVERSGEKKIQREAVPLFVVRAEAVVSPKATQAIIRRADTNIETIDLIDPKSENVLIFPGDIIEFVSPKTNTSVVSTAQFYYIGGEIVSGGQKDFVNGITLTQAILASGGTKRSNIKRVVVRRKNAEGLLFGREYNLRNIKDGKEPDPQILAGDTIELGN